MAKKTTKAKVTEPKDKNKRLLAKTEKKDECTPLVMQALLRK